MKNYNYSNTFICIVENMQTAMELPNGVPVLAACGEGENWLAAH